MKKLIGVALIGAMVLSGGQLAYGGGHGGRGHGHGHGGGHYHHRHGRWDGGWDTFGAVCAGLLGVGLVAAAVSAWDRPAPNYYAYPACPPPPPPVYPQPVYVVPCPPPAPVVYYLPVCGR